MNVLSPESELNIFARHLINRFVSQKWASAPCRLNNCQIYETRSAHCWNIISKNVDTSLNVPLDVECRISPAPALLPRSINNFNLRLCSDAQLCWRRSVFACSAHPKLHPSSSSSSGTCDEYPKVRGTICLVQSRTISLFSSFSHLYKGSSIFFVNNFINKYTNGLIEILIGGYWASDQATGYWWIPGVRFSTRRCISSCCCRAWRCRWHSFSWILHRASSMSVGGP